MQLIITADFAGVERSLSLLHNDVRGPALASAINKTLDLAKTQMGRAITAEFNVKAAYVRERLQVRRASGRAGAFTIEGALIGGKSDRTRSANIIAFVEGFVSRAEGKRRAKAGTLNQLFVKIKRAGGKKALKGAFIGNKGRTVFERTGNSRLPIKPVQTIDVAQMFNTRRINAKVVDVMKARFPEVFEREARFFTDRFNRGGR